MVFIVTCGSYDDYRTEGAYTKIGDARRKLREMSWGGAIECYEGDKLVKTLICDGAPGKNKDAISIMLENNFESIVTPLETLLLGKRYTGPGLVEWKS